MNDSIYPSSKPNERSVGKNYPKAHAIPKEKIKLRIQPCSIPTKFHTIHYDDNEDKGFNSTTKRFNQLLNDLPGPGYYEKDNESQYMHIRATNFGSKLARFKSITTNIWDAKRSPAYYNPKEAVYSPHDTLSPAFRMPIASVDKFGSKNQGIVRSRWGYKPTPGPGSYYLFSFNRGSKSESSVFKSRTNRGPENTSGNLPPPGAYEPSVPTKRVSGAQAAFKGTSRSLDVKSNKTPGPGTYELDPVPVPQKRIERHKFGTISNPHENVRSSANSMTHKNEVPGPGNYEVARASEKIRRGVPIATLGYLPRFTDKQKRIAPGPGDYQLASGSKPQSFHLNLESIWI